jgi:8-oxo-dGTP pyrophosphatase MutT (NUDIX family)
VINAADVSALLRGFCHPRDGESMKSRDLCLTLLDCSPVPFSREQFTPGHITCTGLVLAPDEERVLLVHHRRLDRWLPPGGHLEPEDESAAAGAKREVLEETGVLLADRNPVLAGVDVHGIPAKGAEPYHLHHDLLFLFHAAELECRVSHESHAVAWCARADLERRGVPDNVGRAFDRVRELLSKG